MHVSIARSSLLPWGQSSKRNMFSRPSVPPNRLHPLEIIARTPVTSIASRRVAVNLSASSTTILPKPIYIGGGPWERKSYNSRGGL